jgi:hypothetical protein
MPIITFDIVTKFQNLTYIYGWYNVGGGLIESISIHDVNIKSSVININILHESVASDLGPRAGFEISLLKETKYLDVTSIIEFSFTNGINKSILINDLLLERISLSSKQNKIKLLKESLKSIENEKVILVNSHLNYLDYFDHDDFFKNINTVETNVHDENFLNYIKKCESNSIDAIFFIDGASYILNYYNLIQEFKRILRVGGIIYIHSFQVRPYLGNRDFGRYSIDFYEEALADSMQFILSEMDSPIFLIPHLMLPSVDDVESGAGFENIYFIGKKIV